MTGNSLKVHVDPRLCEGYGICSELSPEVFEIGDDDIADLKYENSSEEHWVAVHAAAAAYPRQAIVVRQSGP